MRLRSALLRVVELADLDTLDGICAVWLATDTDDLVLHAGTDSTLHRQQFVRLAAGIRGSVFAESAYSEVFG